MLTGDFSDNINLPLRNYGCPMEWVKSLMRLGANGTKSNR